MSKINGENIEFTKLQSDCVEFSSSVEEAMLSVMDTDAGDIKLTEEQQNSVLSFDGEKSVSDKNDIDQLILALEERIKSNDKNLTEAKKNNGLVGSIWGWLKDNLNIGDSINNVKTQQKQELEALKSGDVKFAFELITGVDYTPENIEKFLKDECKTKSEIALEEYKIGQEDSADIVGDLVSGVLSVATYSFAIAAFVTGAPLAVAVGMAIGGAALVGAGSKVLTKLGDASLGEKDYKTFGKDVLTGAVNGIMAPIGGIYGGKLATAAVKSVGGKVVKSLGVKASTQVVEQGTRNLASSAASSYLNPFGNVYQGNFFQKMLGYTTEMLFDGSVSGASDATARAVYDGKSSEEIVENTMQGAGFGALAAFGLGWFIKGVGRLFHTKGAEVGLRNIEALIDSAESRDDFVAVLKKIKSLNDSEEKHALYVRYMKKQQEWSAQQFEQFNIVDQAQSTRGRGRPPADPNNPIKSMAIFSREYHISCSKLKSLIEQGEIVLEDGRIDIRNSKNQEFLDKLSEKRAKKNIIQEDMAESAHNFVRASEVARILGVEQHSVIWRTDKTFFLIKDPKTGLYDLEEPHNKDFIEKFLKGDKKNLRSFYVPQTYHKLQGVLGDIPLDYCLDNGLLIKNKDGMIDLLVEHNKIFLERVRNKEIRMKDFKITIGEFMKKCHISIITYKQELKKGNIVLDENKRIDINNPINKKFIEGYDDKPRVRSGAILPDGFVSRKEFADMLGVDSQVLTNPFRNGYIVRDASGAIDIRHPVNKYFIDNYQKGKRFVPMDADEKAKYMAEYSSPRVTSYITQVDLAELLGIQQSTIRWHIEEGHIQLDEFGKIDLENPINAKFLDTHKRGQYYGDRSKPQAKPVVKNKETVNPNACTAKYFARLCGSSLTNILQHINNGLIIRDASKSIDLSNKTNKAFLSDFRAKKGISIPKTEQDLLVEKDMLKNYLEKLLSRENYMNICDINKISQNEVDKYVMYIVKSRIDISNLTSVQKTTLIDLFKEIVFEKIANNVDIDKIPVRDYQETKADVSVFQDLLEALSAVKTNLDGLSKQVKAKELMASLQKDFDEHKFYIDYYAESLNNFGITQRQTLSAEDFDKVTLLVDLIKDNKENDDVLEEIMFYLSKKTDLEIENLSKYYAELFPEEREIFRADFYKDDVKITEAMKIFDSWQKNVKGQHNLSLQEFTYLKQVVKLADEEISYNNVSIMDLANSRTFKDYLRTHKLSDMFKFAQAKNISELKTFMDEANLGDVIIKYDKKSPIMTFKRKSNQNKPIEDCIADVLNYFKRMNGDITISKIGRSNLHCQTDDIVSEINQRRKIKREDYSSLVTYLGFNKNLYGASYDERKMLNVLKLINSDQFSGFIDDVHGRLRFVERFILDRGSSPDDLKTCRAKIEDLKRAFAEAVNTEFCIEKFATGAGVVKDKQAPRVVFEYDGRPCYITFDSDGVVHTLF